MKIIDQYIYAIGQKLPIRGREDVKRELKSLLLDDIEAQFGENPSEEEVKSAIATFGTPGKVAKKYSGENLVIGTGFTDLYFLIFKILIFAMTIAFTVVFVISLFDKDLTGIMALKELGNAVLNIYNSSISSIGVLTIVFIIITRFVKESQVDLEDDWTPKELKSIPIGEEIESKIESFVSIFFILALIIIINFFPQLISFAETSFERSGMILGNTVNLERFTIYAIIMTVIWISELVYHLLILKIAIKTRALKLYNFFIDLISVIVLFVMINDNNLFITNNESTLPSFIGFKGIFLIIAVISIIELLVQSIKWAYKIIIKKM